MANLTNLTPPLFSLNYMYQTRKLSDHICVLRILILSLSTILCIGFWYYSDSVIFYFTFILLHVQLHAIQLQSCYLRLLKCINLSDILLK